MQKLGRVLVIANPASRNGEGVRAAEFVRSVALSSEEFDVYMTSGPGSATAAARDSSRYDTVIVVGGDGSVHETVCGLMSIPQDLRPALGVIPCGNGNDYARTLGMGLDYRDAARRLAHATPLPVDVGLCNGAPFVETLSFGLDAAVAIGTHDRRRRTGCRGTRLFVEEGVSQVLFHRTAHAYSCSFEGASPKRGEMILLAVQIGPTYGGGFRICPDADPSDGMLDVCIAHAPLGVAKTALLFLEARNGRHARRAGSSLSFHRTRSLKIEFECPPPAQIDGETLDGASFDIRVVPSALTVLRTTERASL